MDFDALLSQKNIHLNPQQREAVMATDGPMLLLAVPGSGKTTVIVARCAHMVLYCGIPADQILTLTFNRSARLDMESRFQQVFGEEASGSLRFSTIHSFCNSVLREFGELVGRKVPRLIEEGKPKLLRNLFAQANEGEYLPDDRLDELANTIGFVKNSMMTDEQVKEAQWEIKNFSRIFAAYETYKNENGYMDFDDMLDKALAVFKVRPVILERFRDRYRYINVDEAQDTSKLQHAIIRQLAAPRNNLFMVGDEDQSIYMFRAANPEYLLDFKKTYPDARVLLMERNYRSTHVIVDAAGRLIKRNTTRHSKGMNTGNEIGMPVQETVLADNSSLCDHIVKQLKQCPPQDSAAVLYRENTSAVALMDALDREGIPFYVREHTLYFFDHWVVRDILAYMALGQDPTDMQALKQIYFKLNAYISRELFDKAAELLHQQNPSNALDALLACPGIRENTITRIKGLQQDFSGLTGLSPGAAVQYIMETLGYAQYLKKSGREGFYLESLLHYVESLRAVAARTASFGELLQRIDSLSALAGRTHQNRAGAVTLSTVHSAKGLEFDRVIVTDLIEGRFPTAAAIRELEEGKKALMEEERRLCYVAVTRARKHVELISAAGIYGEKVKPSRFIRELLPRVPVHRMATQLDKKVSALFAPPKPAIEPIPADGEQFPIEIGMEVTHKSFGTGIVEAYSKENGIVAVRFPKYGVKTLAAAYCMGGGMMKKKSRGNEEFE